MADSSVSMKLLIDTHAKRVLFAETDKDCVDFMFYILSLPVANLINLVGKQEMVGSLANLYESIENLNQSYIQPNKTKDYLLKPVTSGSHVPLLALQAAPTTVKKFYTCAQPSNNHNSNHPYYCNNNNNNTNNNNNNNNNDNNKCNTCVSDAPNAVCPYCNGAMSITMNYVAPPRREEYDSSSDEEEGLGFVKGVVTYMAMDDLVVVPMSTISSITLLNKFSITEIGALQEKVVNLGMDEAVKLLKASLETDRVLTTVFLK